MANLSTIQMPRLLQQALITAAANNLRPIEALEQAVGLGVAEFTQELAASFSYAAMSLAQMQVLTPVFERISFSESLQKECVLLQNSQGEYWFVFADVYQHFLPTWAAEHIHAPFKIAIAHHADIAAYLAKVEEDTRTVHAAIGNMASGVDVMDASEELSLHMIEADASPVIKLVRSTLYDALKAEASDIHLETTPAGLVIKYRLDGVLTQMGAISDLQLAEQMSRVSK